MANPRPPLLDPRKNIYHPPVLPQRVPGPYLIGLPLLHPFAPNVLPNLRDNRPFRPYLPKRQYQNRKESEPNQNANKANNELNQNNARKPKPNLPKRIQKGKTNALPKVTFTKTTFEKQCSEMIEAIQMRADQEHLKEMVLMDVFHAYHKILPGLMPQLYGSSFTGIAFNTSDFDVHLHCHGDLIPDKNFVARYGSVLFRSPRFVNTIKVARARVPVIKTTHISGMDLDISATSQPAVHNSILMRYLVHSDTRIRHLIMLISYWAKWNNISGMNLFTSYSIVLLVVFYLQNTDPPLLPPMRDILYAREHYDWPYAIKNDAKLSPELNKSDMGTLFKGFFFFYYKKEFSKTVMSTYLGREIPESDFCNFEILTSHLNAYKRQIALGEMPFQLNIIQLQDPIELNVNTTRYVYPRLLKLFTDSIARFVEKTSKLSPNNWLQRITTEQPLPIRKKPKCHTVFVKYPKEGDNWFENFNTDFKTVCDLLSFQLEEEVGQNKFQKVDSAGSKRKSQFDYILSTNKSPFAKKLRPLFESLKNGMSLEEFKNEFNWRYNNVNNTTESKFQASLTINMTHQPKKPKEENKKVNNKSKEDKEENKNVKDKCKKEKEDNKNVKDECKEEKEENKNIKDKSKEEKEENKNIKDKSKEEKEENERKEVKEESKESKEENKDKVHLFFRDKVELTNYFSQIISDLDQNIDFLIDVARRVRTAKSNEEDPEEKLKSVENMVVDNLPICHGEIENQEDPQRMSSQ